MTKSSTSALLQAGGQTIGDVMEGYYEKRYDKYPHETKPTKDIADEIALELLEIWADLAPDRPLQKKHQVVTKLERLLQPLHLSKSLRAGL